MATLHNIASRRRTASKNAELPAFIRRAHVIAKYTQKAVSASSPRRVALKEDTYQMLAMGSALTGIPVHKMVEEALSNYIAVDLNAAIWALGKSFKA